MIYYLYLIYLMMMGIFLFILSLYFLIYKMVFFIEMELLKITSVKIELVIFLDWMSLIFSSVVVMISCMVILYSIEYMSSELLINRFMNLIILFVLSMILMIMMPNMISILLGWDGLGLVSYCLVIYYQNEMSFNSGMITILTNRIGDIMILMMIGLLMSVGSWNFLNLSNLSSLMLSLILIASITKSAQIPFSSWLPLAMAAPTPVSALVHSSTLVTAGVYLLIRFSYLMKLSNLMNFLMIISILTMLMSGMAANFENDLKKIIAYSTLSQLGLMIFCLSMNLPLISFYHLLTHAMFKSMLFMCAGVIIHNMINNQDIRFISFITFNYPMISMYFLCSNLSLCGIPFLSGFFSKDMILEMYMLDSLNVFILMILFFCMSLTMSYTIRLIYYSFIKVPNMNYNMNYKSVSSLMSVSMLFLFFMSINMGNLLNWILFSSLNLIFLPINLKIMIYFFMMLGLVMGLILSMINYFEINLNKYFLLISFLINLFFLSFLYSLNMYFLMLNFYKLMNLTDNGWNEYLSGLMFIKFLKKLFKLDLVNLSFFNLIMYFFYMMVILMII